MRRRVFYPSGGENFYPVGSDCVMYHAYWSGSAADRSSYNNAGTVYGASYGALGLTFDGTDDYVGVDNHVSLNPTGAITLAAWVNFAAFTDGARMIDKTYQYGIPPYAQYLLDVVSSQGRVGVSIGSSFTQTLGGAALSTGQWYFMWGHYTGAVLRVYRDTTLLNSLTVSGALDNYSTRVCIGTTDGAPVGADTYIEGTIGEAYIFDIDKTLEYMTDLRDGTKGRYGL